MTRSYRLAAVAALVLACTSFVACSAEVSVGSDNLNIKKLEKKLTSDLEGSTGAKVTSLDCPDKVKSEKGKTFSCSFEGDSGISGDVDVKVKDNDGNVTYKTNPASLKFTGAAIAEAISSDFKSTYPDQAAALQGVDCGDSIAATPGTTATCSITSTDGQSAELTVTIDDKGAANWDFNELG